MSSKKLHGLTHLPSFVIGVKGAALLLLLDVAAALYASLCDRPANANIVWAERGLAWLQVHVGLRRWFPCVVCARLHGFRWAGVHYPFKLLAGASW